MRMDGEPLAAGTKTAGEQGRPSAQGSQNSQNIFLDSTRWALTMSGFNQTQSDLPGGKAEQGVVEGSCTNHHP